MKVAISAVNLWIYVVFVLIINAAAKIIELTILPGGISVMVEI